MSADGLQLTLRLTPRGGRDRIDGVATVSDGRAVLAARVSAAPEAGAANRAMIRLLAEALGVPASSIRLEAGATTRLKTVSIAGDATDLVERLRHVAGA